MTPAAPAPARPGGTVSLGWVAVAAVLLHGPAARAQGITVDGRLSAAQTLAGPGYQIGAELGRQVGGNLFHSFGRFGLNAGESATFTGPASVGNVIGRVTGGAPSSINGTIASTIPGASLYLVNPAGVVFGPDARVNVSGAFHASSADYLRLRDGARFHATNPDAGTLSAAPPEAFGFLSASPRPVTVSGATLQAAPGRALGLVGGPVTISGGVLYAPAGTVHVASAAGPGEVPVDPRPGAGPAPTAARSGPVRVERSRIQVSDPAGLGSGGSVFVRGGTIDVAASVVDADNHGPGPGGVVSLRAEGAVAIGQGANVQSLAVASGRGADIEIATAPGGTVAVDGASITVGSLAAGEGGALSIATGALALRNGAVVRTEAQGRGGGGPVGVAADSVLLEGAGTRLLSQTFGAGLVDENGKRAPAGAGGKISLRGGTLTVRDGANAGIVSNAWGDAPGGAVEVSLAGDVLVSNAAGVVAVARPNPRDPTNRGRGGDVSVTIGGDIALDSGNPQSPATIAGITAGGGDAGSVGVRARNVTLRGTAGILSNASSATRPDAVTVALDGDLVLEGRGPGQTATVGGVLENVGSGGSVLVTARNITMLGNTGILSGTSAAGSSGAVTVNARGDLLIDNRGGAAEAQIGSGILPTEGSSGNAGPVTVTARNIALLGSAGVTSYNTQGGGGTVGNLTVSAAGDLVLDGGGFVRADTSNTTNAADIAVSAAGRIDLSNASRISSSTGARGRAGTITVSAGTLALAGQSFISSSTGSPGDAGQVDVTVRTGGALTIAGTGLAGALTGIASQAVPGSTGNAGTVSVRVDAGTLAISNLGGISSDTNGPGRAGRVVVTVDGGALAIDGAGNAAGLTGITSSTNPGSVGDAGAVEVRAGSIAIRNFGNISSGTNGPGRAGRVVVTVDGGALTIEGNGSAAAGTGISSSAVRRTILPDGSVRSGDAGAVEVRAGSIAIRNFGNISSDTYGQGNAGRVDVVVGNGGALTIEGNGSAAAGTGITSQANPGSTGNAGAVRVSAGGIAIRNGGGISSSTFGPGGAGEVDVVVGGGGALTIDGAGNAAGFTGITSQAEPRPPFPDGFVRSGNAGAVRVSAGSVAIRDGGGISSGTRGQGNAGRVDVTVTGGALTIEGNGSAAAGTGITSQAEPGSLGNAGAVRVSAGGMTLRNGGAISSSTFGPGGGGEVDVVVGGGGALTIDGAGNVTTLTGITSQAEPRTIFPDGSLRSGNAGAVRVSAGGIAIRNGGGISSTTRGPGAGGSVLVTTPGALLLDGQGLAGTQITASSVGAGAGDAGTVAVNAGTVTVQDQAQIASSTIGPGRGGDVGVTAGSDIALRGPGPQIATTSTGAGAAGSIAVFAPRVSLRDGAAISTQAQVANGGAITIGRGDLLYLQNSSITTSVADARGNGGDITVEPRFVVLDRGVIAANAVGGNGGDVRIRADQFVQSASGSAVTAFSELAVSGEIAITGPPLNLNGSLVVLASELRAAAALLREGCAVRGGGAPRSSLVAAGRGGRRQSAATTAAEANLPALYFANRPVRDGGGAGAAEAQAPPPVRTSVGLSSRCE